MYHLYNLYHLRRWSKVGEIDYMEEWTGIGSFLLWSCQMSDKLTAKGKASALLPTLPGGMKQKSGIIFVYAYVVRFKYI